MYIICGLGNPGNKYKYTRHNIGFLFLDYLLDEAKDPFKKEKKFKALSYKSSFNEQEALFLKPQTYMNLSGESILPALSFYKIALDKLLVIHDDVDLPLGTIRLKNGGGTGGHNGLASIVEKCGNNFIRLRIGVGRPTPPLDTSDYVLQNFSPEEMEKIPDILDKAKEALSELLSQGIRSAMNKFN